MKVEFDPDKDKINIDNHSISLSAGSEFNFDTAVIVFDGRKNYGEERQIAIGYLAGRLHVLVFTLRENSLRFISLRKANKREDKYYAAQKTH